MISDTPKATKVVCNKHPATKPRTVNRPAFFPLYKVLDKTKILSGPGDNAIKKLAIVKDKYNFQFLNFYTKVTILIFIIYLHKNIYSHEIFLLITICFNFFTH